MVLNLDRTKRRTYGAAQYDGVAKADGVAKDGGAAQDESAAQDDSVARIRNLLRIPVMSEPHGLDPLQDLGTRLKALRADVGPLAAERVDEPPRSGAGFAFAVASHLVAGLVVGAGIGYLLDRWLDTAPWMMVVFFFMGSAAGMLNVYRMASGMDMALGYRPADRGPVDGVGVDMKDNGKGGEERGQSS